MINNTPTTCIILPTNQIKTKYRHHECYNTAQELSWICLAPDLITL